MNTAGRLLFIYEQLLRGRSDTTMVKVWAEIFEIPKDRTDAQVEDDVVTCLQATRAELDLLQSKLDALGVPADLMYPGWQRLRNITAPAAMHGSWNSVRDEAVKPENRLAFKWADWALRDENEADMPAEELTSLRKELDELEASVNETDLSPYMRGFIQRQIEVIRTALRVYRVQGVKPIEEALHKVAGAYTLNKARVDTEKANASESGKSVFARFGSAIEKTAKVADNLDKIRKAGEGMQSLATSVGPLLLTWGKAALSN